MESPWSARAWRILAPDWYLGFTQRTLQMRLKLCVTTLALLAGVLGCSPDTTTPGGNNGGGDPSTKPWASGPLTITATGAVGAVPERYTAEIASDGTWAYTTTWSRRAYTLNG